MSALSELACAYASIALYDDGIPITAENISKMLKAAGVQVASYWPVLFAKLAAHVNIADLLDMFEARGGISVAFSGAAADTSATPAPEEKKKEEEFAEESDEAGGLLGLFD